MHPGENYDLVADPMYSSASCQNQSQTSNQSRVAASTPSIPRHTATG